LRMSEVSRFKVSDINSKRMLLHTERSGYRSHAARRPARATAGVVARRIVRR
jgi:hypothetical protein